MLQDTSTVFRLDLLILQCPASEGGMTLRITTLSITIKQVHILLSVSNGPIMLNVAMHSVAGKFNLLRVIKQSDIVLSFIILCVVILSFIYAPDLT